MIDQLFSLEAKVALVTGSTHGIGYELAKGIAQAGATVVLNGRDLGRLAEAVDELRALGLKVHGVGFDVTSEQEVQRGIQEITTSVGEIDILFNNAGSTIRKAIHELSLDEWNQVITNNLTSMFLVTREVVPFMIKRRAGKIINTCSLMSDFARPQNTPYAASKGGVRMFTRALAVELGPHNIQVNGIGPGYFVTPLTQPLKDNEEFDSWLKKRTPMGRWGELEELIGTAVFLAGPGAGLVSGQLIYIDGGITAGL